MNGTFYHRVKHHSDDQNIHLGGHYSAWNIQLAYAPTTSSEPSVFCKSPARSLKNLDVVISQRAFNGFVKLLSNGQGFGKTLARFFQCSDSFDTILSLAMSTLLANDCSAAEQSLALAASANCKSVDNVEHAL